MLEYNEKENPLSFRACRSSYVTFAVMFGVPLLIGIMVLVKNHSVWQFVAISLAAEIGFFLWLKAFKVTLSDDGITYQTLFSRARFLSYSDIKKAGIEAGYGPGGDTNKPFVRLAVMPHSFSNQQPLFINAKVFNREDLDTMLKVLSTHAKKQYVESFHLSNDDDL